ncbi:hypothetical protein VPNG_05384 [Cytospora leucostoma]|uniref:Uncharacterized protein n=1 Tax=Cytospora leucostoma TaxID=1230097 RepID=A0A423X4Q2_9PEZI|nr:hypothetical protein VPNG_05384 [Cytospora leucostoma]
MIENFAWCDDRLCDEILWVTNNIQEEMRYQDADLMLRDLKRHDGMSERVATGSAMEVLKDCMGRVVPADLGALHDDKRNQTLGYSFLQHKSNAGLYQTGRRFLVQHIDAST